MRRDIVWQIERTERRIGDRAFSVAAPLARNHLQTELKLMRLSTLVRWVVDSNIQESYEVFSLSFFAPHRGLPAGTAWFIGSLELV